MLSLLAPTKYKELRFLDSVGSKETRKAYEYEMIESNSCFRKVEPGFRVRDVDRGAKKPERSPQG